MSWTHFGDFPGDDVCFQLNQWDNATFSAGKKLVFGSKSGQSTGKTNTPNVV